MFSKMGSRTTGRSAAMLGIAAAVFLAVAGFSYRQWKQYDRANREAAQTRAIVDSVDRLLSDLTDAESGQRGYLLTGENRYLEPYDRAVQAIPGDLSAIGSHLGARPDQTPVVARLNDLSARKLAELRQSIEIRRTQGAAPALAFVLSDEGKRTMDQIRSLGAQIRRAEIASQTQAPAEGEAAASTALLATIVGALVLLFAFAFTMQPFASPEPQAWQRPWPVRYGAGVLAVVVIALFRAALTPVIGRTNLPFTMFFFAVAFAAWFGGFRPAVLSIALSLVIGDYFFAAPTGTLLLTGHDDQVAMLMIVVVGFAVALLSRAQFAAVERALRAEQAERTARERFATTLASIGDAVVATDTGGRITYLNPVAEHLTGWSTADAAGRELKDVFRIIHEESRQTVESPVATVLREGEVVALENHAALLSRDGREIAIDDSAAPIRAAGGGLVGVVLVFRDVSAKRAAEQLAAAQTAELRQRAHLMEDVPCFVRDLEDHIVYWNPGAAGLYGFTAGEAVGHISHSLLQTVFPAPLEEIREAFLRAGKWDGELIHTRRDGSRITVASHWALHRDESGEPISILEVNSDVSERLELLAKEQALASERALRQKEVELARVARALSVGELASSIAHEVNQPLAGVATNAEAALRWLNLSNVEEARQSLALIARDANRASAVIRRIREFLRKEAPEAASLDVNSVIAEAIVLTASELARRRIELSTEFGGNLPRVRGNRIQLQQVLLNLLINGAEAMAATEGPRRLAVSTRRSADGVLVSLQDSGAGIGPPDLSRMFEAFFTTKADGMGMGLSISRSIVQAHGGRIWAEANKGPGITVNFSLPAESEGKPVSKVERS